MKSTPFLILLLIGGCNLPLKWDAWRYRGDGVEYVTPWSFPEKEENNFEKFIGDVYVHAYLKAHNETTQGGDSPYGLGLVCYTGNESNLAMIIHSLEVRSLIDGRSIMITPVTRTKNYEVSEVLDYPIKQNFEEAGHEAYSASLSTKYDIDLKPELKESVKITIDIEVAGKLDRYRNSIEYVFTPFREEGEIGYIGPGN